MQNIQANLMTEFIQIYKTETKAKTLTTYVYLLCERYLLIHSVTCILYTIC